MCVFIKRGIENEEKIINNIKFIIKFWIKLIFKIIYKFKRLIYL